MTRRLRRDLLKPDGSQIGDKLAPDQEGLLIAELDLGAIGVAQNAADPAGHYSRPDVTRLLLNKKRYQRVEQFALLVDTIEPTGHQRCSELICRIKERHDHGIRQFLCISKPSGTRHKRVLDDFQPPYPSFVARYKPAVSRGRDGRISAYSIVGRRPRLQRKRSRKLVGGLLARVVPRIGTARTMLTAGRPREHRHGRLLGRYRAFRRLVCAGTRGVDRKVARRNWHLHRGAASHGGAARDAVLLARQARRCCCDRRRHERGGPGARLLGAACATAFRCRQTDPMSPGGNPGNDPRWFCGCV